MRTIQEVIKIILGTECEIATQRHSRRYCVHKPWQEGIKKTTMREHKRIAGNEKCDGKNISHSYYWKQKQNNFLQVNYHFPNRNCH